MPNSKVNDLQIAAWSAEPLLKRPLRLTRFRLSDEAQKIALEWCRERTKRIDGPVKLTLLGLSEVAGLIVPDTSFVREEWDEQGGGFRLSFYFLNDRRSDAGLRRRMQFALGQWLGALFPLKPAAMRSKAAACSNDDINWSMVEVDPTLNQHSEMSACPSAQNPLLWDAVTAYAVAAVSGQEVIFRSGERRVLVAQTPQGQLFSGVELVLYAPKVSADGQKYWSEVVTLCTATFPEQKGIFVLARLSLRNWGPVTSYQRRAEPHRTLDVFVEPEPTFPGGELIPWRHGSLEYHAVADRSGTTAPMVQRLPVTAEWRHQPERDIFRLLQGFTGNTEAVHASLAHPILNQAGLSVLPRLGSGHGDDHLSGGTGLPWPDREAITDSLDKFLTAAGLERTDPMRRIDRKLRKLPKVQEDLDERRKSVVAALKDLGNADGNLDIFLFRIREDTPRTVDAELRKFLGAPSSEKNGVLRWDEGLAIRLLSFPAGPLAEQLLPWPKLNSAELARYPHEQQQRAFEHTKKQEDIKKAQGEMANHVAQARRGMGTGVACALLEMNAAVKGDPWRDPFGLARQELARARCLPKVMLLEGDEQSEHKCRFALRDLFRVLGVSPMNMPATRNKCALAAVTIIQRNRKIVSGQKREQHALPVAVYVHNGVMRCALPTSAGVEWLPYAHSVLRVLTGEYEHFERSRQSDARLNGFFADVFDYFRRGGECLVLIAKDKISKVRTLDNGNLEFDHLAFGNRSFQAKKTSGMRVVRIDNERAKQPCYSHGTDAKWPSGLFGWKGAARTLYALKPKPSSVSMKTSFALQISRHDPLPDGAASGSRSHTSVVRQTPQLEEFCATLLQPGDDPHEWIAMAFALCRVHAQYDAYTNLPFPLHELVCIGKNVTRGSEG